jgi:hypothetical protein
MTKMTKSHFRAPPDFGGWGAGATGAGCGCSINLSFEDLLPLGHVHLYQIILLF